MKSPAPDPWSDYDFSPTANYVTRLLWFCAGADAQILNRCPHSERVKYQGLGGVVLATAVLAFLSGSAALTYEVTWAKLLSLTFGSTTLAASAVVGGFLGGMGVGAWLYHRIQERVASPLRTYAGIEIGIALAAAALTASLPHLPAVFGSLAGGVPPPR